MWALPRPTDGGLEKQKKDWMDGRSLPLSAVVVRKKLQRSATRAGAVQSQHDQPRWTPWIPSVNGPANGETARMARREREGGKQQMEWPASAEKKRVAFGSHHEVSSATIQSHTHAHPHIHTHTLHPLQL